MVEHLQSGDQTMAPEDSAWQAMPHVCEIGCNSVIAVDGDENVDLENTQLYKKASRPSLT